ncbi:NAD(P)/FAD-dependent oxidoreductase [Pseudaminobacter sp. NGMCC 1.201702]|uniref:NAD(P)/FAD-dependent oxidoreductase n=1 Tax=Pseudaminobacter sp. NGMCC 1.201702 TaxID=3391825 RepID=UPI0039F0DCEF
MKFDAIIIGGGPAGSSAAITLARHGWAVAVIEKSKFPRRKVCGEFISSTNSALLDRLGVGEVWRAAAGPEIRHVAFYAGETCVEAPMPRAANAGFGRALGRDLLDLLLLEAARAAGAEIFQPWRAVAIDKEEGAVHRVRIESKEGASVLHAPVVIAAHGSWKPGNLPTQLARTNLASDFLGFKAHFRGSSLAADLMPLLVFPGGYGGMVGADHGRLSLSCCIRRDALAAMRKVSGKLPASEAVQRHLIMSCRGIREAIGDAVLDGRWLAAGPIRPGIRTCYEDDIFRIGNTAGESHPIIAEGISMALQSGWLLASELTRAGASDLRARQIAGQRYSLAWKKLFSTRIHAAAAFAQLAVRRESAPLMRTMVGAFPVILTLGAKLSGKATSVPGMGSA